MIKWIKDKLGITSIEEKNKQLQRELDTLRKYTDTKLAEYTRVDADIAPHSRGNNTVVLTGIYRGKGFVRFYDFSDSDFRDMVERLQHMKKHQVIRNIDYPYPMAGVFDL
jgi:hypothetical protein